MLLAMVSSACFVRAGTPSRAPTGALAGKMPRSFDASLACRDWRKAANGDGASLDHDSFPEMFPSQSCYTRVRYGDEAVSFDPPLAECAYPQPGALATVRAEADRYEAVARGETRELPAEIACGLPDDVLRAVARTNATTLRALADRPGSFPYAAAATFGYGEPRQSASPLVGWLPGQACPRIDKRDLDRLGINELRVGRAARALAAGVAPVITLSGGAVHSRLYEAIMMDWIATCRLGVPQDEVLLDPCADHTHTNVRNTGRLVVALGGRTAFIVTDDGLQALYLTEWNFFDLIGGSVDERALRDWQYLIGSWRSASSGIEGGYWYSPYRFWSDRAGLCVR